MQTTFIRKSIWTVLFLSGAVVTASACGGAVKAPPAAPPPVPNGPPALAEESHLTNLRQLSFGGENAEAYWSFDGTQVILQRRTDEAGCDRIYRMPIPAPGKPAEFIPVSNGKGATTCSYFLPGNQDVIYASTQLGGDACPPKPDHSLGYVWALYDTYDIFRAKADGSGITRLTDTKGYDAEATVCEKDGSIIFTSTRDGDIDLYRMDADGKNVKRLTNTPGYDGGAFFNKDCSKIVWRASRPKAGKELDDFKKLLSQGLVRPSKLELYIANADGSEPQQLTYLDAASFAPFWHPSQKRILFSSNYGDPKGREFDIFAINIDGTGLERITYAKGFDGFPMFSPDGTKLIFASNRATPEGKHDTNVFLADWVEKTDAAKPSSAVTSSGERILSDITWLADPSREGRGITTKGLDASGTYIEERFRALGIAPYENGKYKQSFDVATDIALGPQSIVAIQEKPESQPLTTNDYTVLGFSPKTAKLNVDIAFAEYGTSAKELSIDDYAKLKVKGKAVLVRRFVPEGAPFDKPELQRQYGDLRRKAFAAKEHGAVALVVVDEPAVPKDAPKDWKAPSEAKLPRLEPEGYGDVGIPVIAIKRNVGGPLAQKLAKNGRAKLKLEYTLTEKTSAVYNVIGKVEAAPTDGKRLPGALVIGAHYDHLGHGGRNSLAPGSEEPHVGADDNASGTAVLLEVARELAARRNMLHRDVIVAAFSGEESGVLGSSHFVRSLGAAAKDKVYAMLNMDMVGRMRSNSLQVLGAATAGEWNELVSAACDKERVVCSMSGDGYGPSDQMPFYAAGIPVLHFFTGAHSDYHKPTDTADRINAAGAARTGMIVSDVALAVDAKTAPLTFKVVAGPQARGDMRSFHASLGTIPDYGGPGAGKKGVLLSGVRPGGGADQGGMKRGDVIIKLGTHEIGTVEDLMYVLGSAKPGETVPAVVVREGKEVKLSVTFQEGKR
ncbi:MAG: M28 family peptidase [Polyangiaceae bacterium]